MRRQAWFPPERGSISRRRRLRSAAATLPSHHPPSASQRTPASQRCGSRGSEAEESLARRHDGSGDFADGVHVDAHRTAGLRRPDLMVLRLHGVGQRRSGARAHRRKDDAQVVRPQSRRPRSAVHDPQLPFAALRTRPRAKPQLNAVRVGEAAVRDGQHPAISSLTPMTVIGQPNGPSPVRTFRVSEQCYGCHRRSRPDGLQSGTSARTVA